MGDAAEAWTAKALGAVPKLVAEEGFVRSAGVAEDDLATEGRKLVEDQAPADRVEHDIKRGTLIFLEPTR